MRRYIAALTFVVTSVPAWAIDCKTPENAKTPTCRYQLEQEMAALLNEAATPKQPTSAAEIKAAIDAQIAAAQKQIAAYGPIDTPAPGVMVQRVAMCEAAIRMRLKDPSSAQFRNTTRSAKAGPELDQETHKWHAGVRYSTEVNAKNGFGGYTGYSGAACVFALDEQKILFTAIYKP